LAQVALICRQINATLYYKKVIIKIQVTLISLKKGDYLLFKQIISIMQSKEHLTLEGLQKIVNIRATLNFGLSKELQLMFPETIPVPRPLRETCVIPHPQ
jgi:hypothetical protein